MTHALVAVGIIFLAQTSTETRIDQFDSKGNRTGYLIINQNTGRIDAFDTRSRRQGYGTITAPPSSSNPSSSSSYGSSSSPSTGITGTRK